MKDGSGVNLIPPHRELPSKIPVADLKVISQYEKQAVRELCKKNGKNFSIKLEKKHVVNFVFKCLVKISSLQV